MSMGNLAGLNTHWMVVILVYGFINKGFSQIDIWPLNTYALVGDRVTLPCTIANAGEDATLQTWREYSTSATGKAISSNNVVLSAYQDEYSIEDQYNLVIRSTQLKHGGKYSCENSYQSGEVLKAFAQVIVLGSDTVLTKAFSRTPIIEGDTVKYTCKILYQGRWPPTNTWTSSDQGIMPHIDESESGIVKTSIDFQVGISDHGKVFSCTTSFGPLLPVPGTNEASNIPDYTRTKTTEALDVRYPPTNIKIIDKFGEDIEQNSAFSPGEQLLCIATSNPPVWQYVWTNTSDGRILGYVATLEIEDTWEGLMTLLCTVRNQLTSAGTMEGKGSLNVTINALGSATNDEATQRQIDNVTSGDTSQSIATLLVMALLLVIFLVTIVILLVIVYRYKHKKENVPGPPIEGMPSDAVYMDNMAFTESDYGGYQQPVHRPSYIRPYAYFTQNEMDRLSRTSNNSNASSFIQPSARPQYDNSDRNKSGNLPPLPTQTDGEYDNKRSRIMSDKSVDSRVDDANVYLELNTQQQSRRFKESVS